MIDYIGSQPNMDDDRIRRSTRVTTIILIAAVALNVLYILLSWQLRTWQMYILTGIMFAFILISIMARRKIRSGFTSTGLRLITLGIYIVPLASTLLVADVGVAFAFSLIALTLICAQYLSRDEARQAITVGIFLALITFGTDLLPLKYRLSVPLMRTVIPILTGSILATIFFFFLRGWWNRSNIRNKLIAAFIVITLIPITLLGAQSIAISRQNLVEQAENDLFETAQAAAVTIDIVLRSQLEAIESEAQNSEFVEYLSLPLAYRADSIQERRATSTLLALSEKNPNISSYALLDIYGRNRLDNYPEKLGKNKSDQDYYQKARETGKAYISPFRISPTTSEPSIYFSAPVRRTDDNKIIGVLRVRYDTSYLQELLISASNTNNPEEYAILVDNETFVRIAQTANPNLIFKSYQNFSASEIETLQNDLRLFPGTAEDVLTPQTDIVEGIKNLSTIPVFTAISQTYENEPAYTSGHRLQEADWTVLVRRTERSVLAPLQTQTTSILISALVLLLTSSALGFFGARVLTNPIINLTGTAQKIAEGELRTRATITTKDEVATLASTFNTMADQLQGMLSGLEDRITERTSELEVAQQQSEKRSRTLENIAEISRIISIEQSLERLLPLITDLASNLLGYYHIGIFLVDEVRQYAVLQAANSEGGKKMLNRQHRLEIGQKGIVGYVAKQGEPRIALDVGEDAVFFDNPDLPETRSEIALPLQSRNKIIGVLDVQSLLANAFSDDDVRTLRVLADQVAIAIENARLFEQSQQSLEDLQQFYQQYIRREWETLTTRDRLFGYHQKITGASYLENPIQSKEIDQAIKAGDVVIVVPEEAKNEGSNQTVLAAPIQLRGETLGVMKIQNPAIGHPWTEGEINMVRAVADRLALAIENVRLLEEAQRRASKEQVIGEISSKISGSINMRNVLQTAVEELGRVIPGSNIVVQFQETEQEPSQQQNKS